MIQEKNETMEYWFRRLDKAAHEGKKHIGKRVKFHNKRIEREEQLEIERINFLNIV
jgi:hypothetical protein